MADAQIEKRADDQSMGKCGTCGGPLDERGYQVIVWGLGAFDSVECAEKAMRRRRREHGDGLAEALARAASQLSPQPAEPQAPVRED